MGVFDLAARPFLAAAAAAAARELGLPAALPCPAAELAAALGVRPRRLGALVYVLVLEGLVRRDGGLLRPGAPPPPAAPPPREGWGRLAEVIRADRPLPLPDDDESRRRYHDHLRAAGAAAASELAALLPDGVLLDAGGGAGAYTAAYLDAHPGARAVLVDRPAVLALAEQALARFGGRARLVAGDILEVDGSHDVALLSNVLHLHGPETCRALVARVAGALAPGGTLVVQDLRVEPDRSGPPEGVLFALNMALYTDGGTVYDAGEIRGFLDAAGLQAAGELRLGAAPEVHVIVARKIAAEPPAAE